MTDERLEQLLKKSLAPEISQDEILVHRNDKNKRRTKRIAAAVLACAATLAVSILGGHLLSPGENASNEFVLSVHAAELKHGTAGDDSHFVPSADFTGGYGGGGGGHFSYNFDCQLHCEGKNIDTITYAINKGAFSIADFKESRITFDEKRYPGELNTGYSGGRSEYDVPQQRYVTEYTVSYDAQENEDTWICICGEFEPGEAYFRAANDTQGKDPQARADWFDEVLDGVEIRCTVRFKDGSLRSETIIARGKVMTPREANDESFIGAGEEADQKMAYLVLGLK